ncbi:hypothetical protein TVAG_352490 [Trichomonas vaginalis G3]|uniref:RING-type domain-containing protein n=1 Tax=Trichomonas vaginalis (strain ATCC PRA-98 / G3) TaxID=412133 RepID=A2EG51_TRIV3|nr:E3 ubiquitin-protein ligase rad18 family [Trichomonas vaginalis G3]EAY08327.1 hypothetical protein TVAG_352490 [Trichomonas vaginalis G3]KAI5546230.1 E3 ubiquitin-protein ligase rad18 family [Trichomonas vaginalis G3]|eukprot:XP_001320550.1 hypothetical protein [Trichomonas vaginalis G3]
MNLSLKQKIWLEKAMQEHNQEESTQLKQLVKEDQTAEISSVLVCKKCHQDMTDDDHKPMSLAPCGHTLCKNCLEKLESKRCPFCNAKIEATAINFSLKKISENIEDENVIPDFKQKLDEVTEKIAAIFERLDENKKNQNETQEKIRINSIVLNKLKEDFEEIKLKRQILGDKLEEARKKVEKATQEEEDLTIIVEEKKKAAEIENLENIIKSNN